MRFSNKSINRNFESSLNFKNISNDYLIPIDLQCLSLSDHIVFVRSFGYLVEFLELLLLLEVIGGRNDGAHSNSQ